MQGYMSITAHYCVDSYGTKKELAMKSSLIAFRYVRGSHSGKRMAQEFLDVVKELSLEKKVSNI
jgi:hypothetical protein